MTIETIRSGERPRTGDVRAQRRDRRSLRSRLSATLLVIALATAPTAAFADDAAETGRESGLGAAAALSTLVYGPVKLLYATGGLIVGSFAWAFTAGDTQVAEKVFTRSLRGTYVITPDHLTGEQPLLFIGRADTGAATTTTTRPEAVASAASAQREAADEIEGFDDSGYDEMGW